MVHAAFLHPLVSVRRQVCEHRYGKTSLMASISETLCAIEQRAERAIVQELRLLIKEVQALQPTLTGEDLAHANAVQLKLEQLSRNQLAESVEHPALIEAPELDFDFID